MSHDFASVMNRGRLDRPYPAGQVARHSLAIPEPISKTRGLFFGECWRLVLLDLVIVGTASFAAGSTWFATVVRTAATVLALAVVGLYRPRLQLSVLDDVPQLLLAVGLVVPLGALWPLPTLMVPSAFAATPIAWPAALLAGALVGRAGSYAVLRWRRRRIGGEPTIVIGSGDVAVRLVEVLREDRTYGLAPLGLVGSPPLPDPAVPAPLLGPVGDLDKVVSRYGPSAVVVAFPGPPDADLVGSLRRWRRLGIAVFVVPRLFELAVGRTGAELVHGIPLVRMRPEPPRRWRRAAKRLVDVAGAAFGLVVLSPLFAGCALAVRWETHRAGPPTRPRAARAPTAGVLFRQERIGCDGKPFTMMKFRSLTPSSELESRVRWNINRDTRVGPVGRLLRSTSLDELPQLLNVLRGDMSLVGPRPERPFFVEQFQRTYTGYLDRHRMPAGITGWAQIHGLRGDTSIEERVRFDNYYIENWSLGLDLKIIVRTIGSMLSIHRR